MEEQLKIVITSDDTGLKLGDVTKDLQSIGTQAQATANVVSKANKQEQMSAEAFAAALKQVNDLSAKSAALRKSAAAEQSAAAAAAVDGSKKVASAAEEVAGKTVNTTRTLHDLSTTLIQSTTGGVGFERSLIRLVEAFDFVQRGAGGFTQGLQALGGALIGPSGIILGVSAVISVVTALKKEYGSFSAGIQAINPLLSDHERVLLDIANATRKGIENGQAEIAHLNALFEAVKNVNVPMDQRILIADELQKRYPKILGNLSQEAILAGNTAAQYKELAAQILAAAQSKALEETIAEQGKKMNALQETARKLNEELAELRKPQTSFIGSDPVAIAGKIDRLNNVLNANKKAQKDITDAVNQTVQAQQKLIEQSGAAVLGITDTKNIKSTSEILKTLQVELDQANAKVGLLGSTARSVAAEKISALKTAFDDLIKNGLKPTSPEVQKISDQINALGGLDAGKKVKTISDVLKQLQAELKATDVQAQATGLSFDNISKEKISSLQRALDALIKLGVQPSNPELKKITDQINLLGASIIGNVPIMTANIQALGKAVQTIKKPNLSVTELADLLGVKDRMSHLELSPKLKVAPIIDEEPMLTSVAKYQAIFNERITKLGKDVQYKIDSTTIVWGNLTNGIGPAVIDLGKQLQGLAASAAVGLGEVIGEITSGTGNLASSLGKLVGVMGQFIVDFGKSLIEAATLRIIAEKTLFANPYVALAAGIAAVAVGTVLKKSVPSFATGGTVYGEQLALIGDNPARKEHILNDNQLQKIAGTGSNRLTGEFILRGPDLQLAVTRAIKDMGRIN